jgi:hypothetical protein
MAQGEEEFEEEIISFGIIPRCFEFVQSGNEVKEA